VLAEEQRRWVGAVTWHELGWGKKKGGARGLRAVGFGLWA